MPRPGARRTLVLGGARSGKSTYAEHLLRGAAAVEYVACGPVASDDDPEWRARVERHQARRPGSWTTVETTDLVAVLGGAGPPVLIDCLTTWLAQTLDACGVWAGAERAEDDLGARVDALVSAWATTRRRVVAVSNEVGSAIIPATESGRRFTDEIGILNARVAAASDRVWLVTAGIPKRLR
jgi:adenosylcobinamide kinase/adenosylcobinamide-phosphate guanylyltransferase